jgi:hypothetical protein
MNNIDDELNRDFDMADHIDWIAIAQIDEAITKTQARIKALETRKAELQASNCTGDELASIERDLRYETRRLAALEGDRRAVMGYLD